MIIISLRNMLFGLLTLLPISAVCSAESLLGGGAQEYATIWAQPQTASFSRFLFRTATNIRYDLNIVLTFEQEMDVDYRKTLRDAALMGTLPHAAIMPLPLLLELKDDLPIAAFPLNYLPEDISPEALESAIVDGEVLGLPLHDGNHQLLYYNKQLTNAPVKDLTNLISYHRSKANPDIDTIIWDYSRLDTLCEIFPCSQGMKPNASVIAQSLGIFQKLIDENVSSSRCDVECTKPRCFYLCMIESFYEGNVAYMINGDWELSEALQHLGTNLGIAPIPNFSAQPATHYRYPNLLVFFDKAFDRGKKNTSLKLAYYLLNNVVQKRMFSDTDRIPVNETYLSLLYEQLIPNSIESDNILIMQSQTVPLLADNPASRYHNHESEFLMKLFIKSQLQPLDSAATRLMRTYSY